MSAREITYELSEQEFFDFLNTPNQEVIAELDDEIVSPESSAYAGVRILEPEEFTIEIWENLDYPPKILAFLHEPEDEITILLPRVLDTDEDYLALGRFIFSKFYHNAN